MAIANVELLAVSCIRLHLAICIHLLSNGGAEVLYSGLAATAQVPYLHGAVSGTGSDHVVIVGLKSNLLNTAFVAGQNADSLLRLHIDDTSGLITARGRENVVVRGECNVHDGIVMYTELDMRGVEL